MFQAQTKLELDGEENKSISNFLNKKNKKIVRLDRILGIGGEGLVLKDEIWTREYHYRTKLGKKEKKEVAVKFVKFEKRDEDDFDDSEEADEDGSLGGIKEDGSFVRSNYFEKMWENLGDFVAAMNLLGGYVAPYEDFGISQIYGNHYFIIGKPKC